MPTATVLTCVLDFVCLCVYTRVLRYASKIASSGLASMTVS